MRTIERAPALLLNALQARQQHFTSAEAGFLAQEIARLAHCYAHDPCRRTPWSVASCEQVCKLLLSSCRWARVYCTRVRRLPFACMPFDSAAFWERSGLRFITLGLGEMVPSRVRPLLQPCCMHTYAKL